MNSKLMDTAEHNEYNEFCWEQQIPGFLQKGVTSTWFYQFTNSFFDSTDVFHPYCIHMKNFVPWVCRRRTRHVLHAKLCKSNSLSHYTNFFSRSSQVIFFCSCCLFICLFMCLKFNLVIEKNTWWTLMKTGHRVHCPTCSWVSKLFWWADPLDIKG